jgi:hypothetical protein
VPKVLAVGDDAADRNAAEADAVIAALAADQPGAPALAAHLVIGERDLQRGIDASEPELAKNTWSSLRAHGREARGQFKGLRMAHLEGRARSPARRPVPGSPRRSRAAVAGIAAPQARRAVQHLAAVMAVV